MSISSDLNTNTNTTLSAALVSLQAHLISLTTHLSSQLSQISSQLSTQIPQLSQFSTYIHSLPSRPPKHLVTLPSLSQISTLLQENKQSLQNTLRLITLITTYILFRPYIDQIFRRMNGVPDAKGEELKARVAAAVEEEERRKRRERERDKDKDMEGQGHEQRVAG